MTSDPSEFDGQTQIATRAWFSIPQDVRNLIYEQLFSNRSLTVTANMHFDWPKTTASQNLCLVQNPRNASTAILLTCRQVYQEARKILYQCVDYVCIGRYTSHSTTFNRFGYEYFDFARSHVRRIWGFPFQTILGDWPDVLFDKFPQLEVVGLEFDMMIPVVKIRLPGASFPVMTHERLLKAMDVFLKSGWLEKTLTQIRTRRPSMRVLATFNFFVGHVDEDRQMHMMTLIELVNRKVELVIYRHEDCPQKVNGEGQGTCHKRIAWPELLDMMDGKCIDVGRFPI